MNKPVITLDDQIKAVSREITMRLLVYPTLVKRGKLTMEKAEFEQRCMGAVLETLRGLQPGWQPPNRQPYPAKDAA